MKYARVAGPLVAVLMVAGCGTPSGGTAFSVDGRTVSQRTVDESAKACATITGSDATQLRARVGQLLLMGELAPALAKATGVALTPAMQGQAMAQLDAGELLSDPACARTVQGVANFSAITTKLGQEKAVAALKELDVKVNPSYGSFDPSQAQIVPSSGSLSSEDLGLGKVFGN